MQKGFTPIIILVGIVVLVGIVGGGYYFIQQQKIKNINSFEECAKVYPVMMSYPGQCRTPDGRSFTQQIPEEEKKKTLPPADETANWKIYTDPNGLFSFKYPNDPIFKFEYRVDSNVPTYVLNVRAPYKNSGYFTFLLEVNRNENNLTNDKIKQEVLSYKPSPGPYQSRYINIKDYQNGEINGVYYQAEGSDQPYEFIKQVKAANIYTFTFYGEHVLVDGEARILIDKILSTFNFLDASPLPTSTSQNQCGDGVCQQVTCAAIGCPQPETHQNCPQDCK